MSDESQLTQQTANDPLEAGVGWVAKHWPRIRLGHEGLMLDKIDRQHRIVETLARNTMTGDMKDVAGWPGNEGDDAMGVNIGDHIHYHQAVEPVAKQQAVAPAATTTPLWQKLLTSAAMLASGAGAGAGVPWLLGAFDRPAVVQPAATAIDTDTQYELSIQSGADK